MQRNLIKQDEKYINYLVNGLKNIFAKIFNEYCIQSNENESYYNGDA